MCWVRVGTDNQTVASPIPPYTSNSAHKCEFLTEGITHLSGRNLKLDFFNVSDYTYPPQNASLTNSRITTGYNGNVGISNTTSQSMLHLGNSTVAALQLAGSVPVQT